MELDNELHIFCLHYVFVPRINWHLDLFTNGYDNHPLRTESNMTPNQMWVYGLSQLNINHNLMFEQTNINMYGVDFEGPLPSQTYSGEISCESSVEDPPTACPLNDQQLESFQNAVDPLVSSSSHGLDIYLNAINFIQNILQSQAGNNHSNC